MIAGHFRKGAMCQLAWVHRRVIEQSPYGAVPGYRLHTHRCLTQRPPRRPREISRSDVGMLHGRAHWKYEIGRASCRERVEMTVVRGAGKIKTGSCRASEESTSARRT